MGRARHGHDNVFGGVTLTTVGNLMVTLGMDAAPFESGMASAERSASSGSEKISGHMGGIVGAIGGIAIAAGGFMALKGGIESILSSTENSEKAMALTEAVIQSTGEAAGYTAPHIAAMAGKLSTIVPVSKSVIESADNVLLRFTNIGHDVFPQAQLAAVNMGIAMKTGPEEAAKTLGIALNNPEAGYGRLTRAGIQFTDKEKAAIKAMQDSGNMAGAQALMLDKITKATGGAAEAVGKTLPGQMTILNNVLTGGPLR